MSVPMQTGMGMSTSPAEEASGLKKIMWFAIVQLVGLVAGWVTAFYAFASVFMNASLLSTLPPNPTPSQVSAAMGPVFHDVIYIIPISLGIAIVGYLVLFYGFRDLARVDSPKFSTPRTLTLLLVIGIVFVGAGLTALFNSLPNLIAQAPTLGTSTSGTPSSAFMSQLGSLLAYLGIMLLGGILGLVGIIGGLILGLWRVGTRYNQTTLKLGAIFEVIPLLNIVAPILILLGAMDAKSMVSK